MSHETKRGIGRREMLETLGKAALGSAVVASPLLKSSIFTKGAPVNGVAGVDRVVVLPGKTYLRGWVGYGEPPRRGPRRPGAAPDSTPPAPTGPEPKAKWSKRSGPGRVAFADP